MCSTQPLLIRNHTLINLKHFRTSFQSSPKYGTGKIRTPPTKAPPELAGDCRQPPLFAIKAPSLHRLLLLRLHQALRPRLRQRRRSLQSRSQAKRRRLRPQAHFRLVLTDARRQICREREILRRVAGDSPFIVRCCGVSDLPGGDLAALMEYMDRGTLDSALKSSGTFSEDLLADVAIQALNGLKYLHSHKIVHCDIKPAKLLVNSNWEVKIADFGVGRIMGRTLDPCNSYVGTCAYMSPERFDPDRYGGSYNGYAADIWSLGLTLMELYLGYFPFLSPGERPDWATLMCAICFSDPPELPEGSGSKEFRSFVSCCLQKEASKRWSAAQLLTHPFICKKKLGES